MTPPATPITIHRSIVGLLGIFVAGLMAEMVIFGTALIAVQDDIIPAVAVELLALMGVVVLAVTIISIAVYEAGRIVLDERGIHVRNYKSLFANVEAVVEWDQLQDVTVTQSGVFQSLSGAGTILFQSAGTETNLSMAWVPRATYWRDYIFGIMHTED